MNLRTLHDKLSTNLSLAKNKIEIENSSNNQSLNILFESVFLEILNIIFEYKFVNANLKGSNFPGIDGIDIENRKMVQITSTFSIEKIENTIKQIIVNKLYNDFDELYFIFLKGKKSLNRDSKLKIEKLIDNKFKFIISDNCIDQNDIYRLLTSSQDFEKAINVNRLLENTMFGFNNTSSDRFDYIGLSFDDEELQNVFILAKTIIKTGINVVTSSKALSELFKKENSKLIDGLILINNEINTQFVSKFVLVVSKDHICNNIDAESPTCKIFKECLTKDVKPLLLTFTDFTDSINKKVYKNPRTVNVKNTRKIEEIINNFFLEKPTLKFSFENIKEVLKSLFPTFKLLTITKPEEKHFCIYNFSYGNYVINFLIFSHEYKRSEVISKFNKDYKKGYSENLFILAPKDYNQTTNLRLKNLKDLFPNNNQVFFIDEYLYDNSLNGIEQNNLLLNEVFISPFFEIDKDIEKLDDILDWIINEEDSPVAFIIGSGGDGKTTICQKIHDEIINDFDKSIVVFLDAHSYITEIRQREKIDNWKFDLQTVFEISNTQIGNIDLKTFKSNFAFGNITVIIDGIDEVISTLPNFSLKDFLEDFNTLKDEIGRGKLIINCRDIYIDELSKVDENFKNKYKIYNLLKFNAELAKKYFKKHFNNNDKKVNECIKLLDEFYDKSEGEIYIYSPFVLEIIYTIVENDFNYEEIEYLFESKILLKNNSNDYLIYKICKREIAKKESHGFTISVDNYVRLLCLISIEKNGLFDDNDFNLFLKKLKIDLSADKVRNSLRDNPFFYLDKTNYRFRFDFYNSVFKANAIYAKLTIEDSFELTDSFISIISEELNYNSIVFEGLKNKIKDSTLTDDELIKKTKSLVLKIIDNNSNLVDGQGYNYSKKLSISNLTILLASIKSSSYSITEIICSLFADDNFNRNDIISINNLYLIDIPSITEFKIDFSKMYLTNSVIENYSKFLECKFDEDTFFDNTCSISKINSDSIDIKKCTISKNNFDNFILSNDNSLYKAVNLIDFGGENILSYLRKYFRSFIKGNKVIEKINVKTLPLHESININIHELNDILYEFEILIDVNKDEVTINPSKKLKILNFINQNLTFTELNKTIRKIETKTFN